jgi:hypothetical protein
LAVPPPARETAVVLPVSRMSLNRPAAGAASRQRRRADMHQSVCCIAYKICCRKKHQSSFRLLRKTRGAEFLDDAAKIFVFSVIFQSIAAKSCSRALFRHAV